MTDDEGRPTGRDGRTSDPDALATGLHMQGSELNARTTGRGARTGEVDASPSDLDPSTTGRGARTVEVDSPPGDLDARTTELKSNLAAVRDRIARACADAGRSAEEVTLVVITKTFPADDVRRLSALGVVDIGENRDQEAAAKARTCSELGLRWHFVGQLQTNKARSVGSYAEVIHSIDRERLVEALDRAAETAERRLIGLVQVSLDDVAGRGGADPKDVPRLAEMISETEHLGLGGVMAVAPLSADPWRAFERLASIAADLRAEHPHARVISAGMSGDLEAAIAAGATHLRVGSAVLGRRPVNG